MFAKLKASAGWQFFAVLPRADRALALSWWSVLLLRGLLPALFAVAIGLLVGVVQRGSSLVAPLTLVGIVFLLLQVLSPLHQAIGANLGSRMAAWLYDQLTLACVRPPGMGHLENPRLTTDLTMARDFDLGISGPPLSISMGFIASGLAEMVGGIASALCDRLIAATTASGSRKNTASQTNGGRISAQRRQPRIVIARSPKGDAAISSGVRTHWEIASLCSQ